MTRKVSRRAQKVWDRLGSWYGSRVAEAYGPNPPEDWAELFDRTDDERLDAALIAVRRESPKFPPTLGDVEKAIPKRETGNSGPSKPERLCVLMMKLHGAEMCPHQLARPWNYFGPLTTFELLPAQKPPAYVTHPDPRGVQVPTCEPCGRPSYRVRLEQEIAQGVPA